jgi:hypothetical protein
MRRLLYLLIGLLALGATMPAAAAHKAHHGAHRDMAHAMPPDHCPDEGQGGAIHVCLGCAIDPAGSTQAEPVLLPAIPMPVAYLVSVLNDHSPGFDPPPPRGA